MKKVEMFTDGACKGNPGPGRWGALLRMGQSEKELTGCEPVTPINRMGLTAACKGLSASIESCQLALHTDITYITERITKRRPGWQNPETLTRP